MGRVDPLAGNLDSLPLLHTLESVEDRLVAVPGIHSRRVGDTELLDTTNSVLNQDIPMMAVGVRGDIDHGAFVAIPGHEIPRDLRLLGDLDKNGCGRID